MDFSSLPRDCFATIISLTSPLDACRLSLVSPFFNSVASSDAVWAKFLPAEYQNLAPTSPSVSSLKATFLNLCDHPVLIEDGKKSFALDKKSGRKCYMVSPRCLSIIWSDNLEYWRWISIPESRFAEVALLNAVCWFQIRGKVNAGMLSPMTHYKTYLVFMMEEGASGFEDEPFDATVGLVGSEGSTRTVYLNVNVEDEYAISKAEGEDLYTDAESEDVDEENYEEVVAEAENEDVDEENYEEVIAEVENEDVNADSECDDVRAESENEEDAIAESEDIDEENEEGVVEAENEDVFAESESDDVGAISINEEDAEFRREHLLINSHQIQYLVMREDGWFEVELGDFFNEGGEDDELEMHMLARNNDWWKRGIIIQGWEVRPNLVSRSTA